MESHFSRYTRIQPRSQERYSTSFSFLDSDRFDYAKLLRSYSKKSQNELIFNPKELDLQIPIENNEKKVRPISVQVIFEKYFNLFLQYSTASAINSILSKNKFYQQDLMVIMIMLGLFANIESQTNKDVFRVFLLLLFAITHSIYFLKK